VVATGGAWSWYEDAARSGPGVAARATLRVKPLHWLAVRAGYAYSQRWAEVDACSTRANRVIDSVEARVAPGVYLGVAYTWQWGEQTLYASTPGTPPATSLLPGGAGSGTILGTDSGPGPGGGTGPGTGNDAPQGSGVFENLIPYLASTTDSTLTPTFEAAGREGLYLFATYSYTWGSSGEGSYTAQGGLGGAGYRFSCVEDPGGRVLRRVRQHLPAGTRRSLLRPSSPGCPEGLGPYPQPPFTAAFDLSFTRFV
jgi:hypothetical protein